MQKHSWFTTVHNEGSLLPLDLLQRIAAPQGSTSGTRLEGLTATAYHLEGERLNEAINQSWNRMRGYWSRFQAARARLPTSDLGTTLTRERWLLPLFSELGYGRLTPASAIEIDDRSYPISHIWNATPLHLVSYRIGLDERPRGKSGTLRASPYSLVQEVVNRDSRYLWGMVSNGLRLRLLRNNASLTRQSYIEFDLEAMMEGEVYADFVLFWLLCHESRVEGEKPTDCWLERWLHEAQQQGIRALELLRTGVEHAIQALGSGFLAYTASSGNQALRDKLRSGELSTQDYYRQLLRLVYRLIVLFVAEDRDILFHPDADDTAKERYRSYYSTQRLRQLAARRSGTRHADLYYTLRLITEKLGDTYGCPELGLPALNGFLFSLEATADLNDCILANADLLDAVRALAFTMDKQRRRAVDYKNLGSEELGSVYESLLELHPLIHLEAVTFELASASGNERKTSGSYYTPTSLITSLLDTALDPVLEEAYAQPGAERAILNLKVCDPACGSGHFLIAAAHRIAKRLAMVRTGEEEPGADERRHALRDVISSCIYGVDMNPMAVELCKVSLWLEAIEPGKPLSFLDHHIQCGNSLLGATPALLSEGIPDRAFEPIEGDNKELCRQYKKQNKLELDRERQTHAGQLGLWDAYSQAKKDQQRLEAGMRDVDVMSDADVASIHRKQASLDAMQHSLQYRAQKMRADAWCAAFVQVKLDREQDPITHDLYQKINDAANPDALFGSDLNLQEMRDNITRLADQYKFFHWHLAFPDVFRLPKNGEEPENEQAGWSGGFDCVLGNPPFLGGLKISGTLGDKYRHLLTIFYEPFANRADLCTAFLRRYFNLIKLGGMLGLVTTNTIGQGDTREVGLAVIIRQHGVITTAYRFIKWSGDANIEVNLITVCKGKWNKAYTLDGSPVSYISSRLDNEPETELRKLLQNQRKAFQGHIPRGDGFIIEPNEAEYLINEDAHNKNCIYPYLNGRDFNTYPNQCYSRYIICFHDWSLEKASLYPHLLKIVEERVKSEREKVKQAKDRVNWWLFNSYRQELGRATRHLKCILVRSRVSELHMLAFVPKSWIFSEQTISFAFDDYYHFSLLQSNLHEVWVHRNASTMRTDIRYTPTDCFETFPFPQNIPVETKQLAEGLGKIYYEHRQEFMLKNQLGLTSTYNLFHKLDCNEPDIVLLREQHANMDQAILACYGWNDVDLRHNFYQNERGQTHYTISDIARREVLLQLLALNHEIALSEIS